ncbi:membrane lipoprotein lipid attachment site-containing protein [Paenisporosarcina quisquiliarum]|uniref:Membrane lipoprotein lipid attachment site-containing protein n=1 Tax=Paenisporosarcina quisquiliarum TaxID=365346 RepID=A0A9X3LIV9_9BACL|nr:DUF4352 domain-containing protein [Paenisporosarcina quisquiliarum]MCZ8538225.1 membrane lipoprotein lipid attachment site-containing protein [Paenisporosarcina quisquiliarum]
MKKLSFFLILLLVLTGCSSVNNTENKAGDQVKTIDQTQKNLNVKKDVYVPNPQITDDINLVTVGETVTDDKGELTLKSYKRINKAVNIGGIEMVLKEVKLMHFVPDYSMIDFFHSYTHEEEFDFLKVEIEVKNTSDEDMKFTPVAFVKTSNGELKTWEDDIFLEELNGEIQSNNVKKGNMGFILENTNDIKSIEILTSDVLNNVDESIEKAKTIKEDI